MKNKRVVITGIGITSSLGHSLDEVSTSLANGKNNFISNEMQENRGFHGKVRADIPQQTKYKLERRKRRFMSESAIYSALSWMKAIDENNLAPEDFTGPEVGIITGNDSSSQPLEELMDILHKYKETHFLGSNMVIKVMNSCCSMNLGPLIGAQGINLTMSAGEASGAHAIGYAYQLLRCEKQQAIVTGAFQEVNWIPLASFDAMGIFSKCEDTASASRPFDISRDGAVPSGGGAVLLLETLERAQRLGHPIYGEIIGYHFNSGKINADTYKKCMRGALLQANITADQVDYINANACGLPSDQLEIDAISEVFGPETRVSSTKSISGHEFWMSGASEIAYSLLMMRDGFLAPNANFKQQTLPPKINILSQKCTLSPKIIISNNFAMGGTNASLVIKEFAL